MTEPTGFVAPACRNHPLGNHPWFPPLWLGSTSQARKRLDRIAKDVCARCPHIDECLAWSLEAGWELNGTWGGLTQRERALHRRHPS